MITVLIQDTCLVMLTSALRSAIPFSTNGTEKANVTGNDKAGGFDKWIIFLILIAVFTVVFSIWKCCYDHRKEKEAKLVCDAPRAPGGAIEMRPVQRPARAVVRDRGRGNAGEEFPSGCLVM